MEDKTYTFNYRCATCGSEDCFESNEDKTYIKCTRCNREYLGGLDELHQLNTETIEDAKEYIQEDIAAQLKKELINAFKGNKYIKIK